MLLQTYNLPTDNFFPESIGFQPETGYFFTGSLAHGQIVRGNVATGEVISYLPSGVNNMKGVAGIKLDAHGHLFVAGGYDGTIFIYQADTAALLATFQVDAKQSVVNDFAVLPTGEIYVTDSVNPYLYKISATDDGKFNFDPEWLSLQETVINYEEGLNLNGIAVSADNRFLVVGQTNTGKLFRVEIATKQVNEIDLGGEDVLHADGILLEGQNLYVACNAFNTLATVQLSEDFLQGKITAKTVEPAFQFPTALIRANDSFLIVNAQLDKMALNSTPVLPFNIIAISVPQ